MDLGAEVLSWSDVIVTALTAVIGSIPVYIGLKEKDAIGKRKAVLYTCAVVLAVLPILSAVKKKLTPDPDAQPEVVIAPEAISGSYLFHPGESFRLNVVGRPIYATARHLRTFAIAVLVDDSITGNTGYKVWDQFWDGTKTHIQDAPAGDVTVGDVAILTVRTHPLAQDEVGAFLSERVHLYVVAAAIWRNKQGFVTSQGYCARMVNVAEAVQDSTAAMWQSCLTHPFGLDE